MTPNLSKRNPGTQDAGAIEWLQLVLASVTLVALVVIYLLLPSSNNTVIDLIRQIIPNAVTALLVVPVVYIVLARAGLSLEDRIVRAISQALASPGPQEDIFPDDIGQAAEMIKSIVEAKPRRKTVTIEVLAFTGSTFTTGVLRELINSNPGRISLIMRTIDFEVAGKALFPAHWPSEEEAAEKRLESLSPKLTGLEIWRFPAFPFMLGLAIDDTDLFITFSSWSPTSDALEDRRNEYRHYVRSESTEHHFRLFRNWASQPRQKLITRRP